MKLAKIAAAVVAVTALGLNAPAPAQAQHHVVAHHPFHLLAQPAVCPSTCGGTSSAQWVVDHSHFHGTLSLQASGCGGGQGTSTNTGVSVLGTEAGGVINAGGLPVGNLSFDYETEYCGNVGDQFVFVYVTTTDGDSFFEECADFPSTGASNTFIHEVFTNSQFDFASNSKFDTIEIGIFNSSGGNAGHALVRNIVVDGIVVSPDFHPEIDFCADISR